MIANSQVLGGSIIQACDAFDFASTNAYLSQFSSFYGTAPSTGVPLRSYNTITFNANPDVTVNVFHVPASLFEQTRSVLAASLNQCNPPTPHGTASLCVICTACDSSHEAEYVFMTHCADAVCCRCSACAVY